MKNKKNFLAAILFLCAILLLPTGKAAAATPKISSVSAIYQTTTKVTVKATAGYKLRLKLNGRTYSPKSQKNGTYTFIIKKTSIGKKAVVTMYNKKTNKKVASKTVTVKGSLTFKVTGYDTMNHIVKGNGTAGRRVRVRIGSKTYTTVVSSDGTWKKTIPSFTTSKKTVKVSQQNASKVYSTEKSVTINKSTFNTAYLKKGRKYYTKGYSSNPKTTWVGFEVKEVIGNKMYFNYTVCEIKNGKGTPKTYSAIGTITGKNKMVYGIQGVSGTFTWSNSKKVTVKAVDTVFGYGTRTEVLTAK